MSVAVSTNFEETMRFQGVKESADSGRRLDRCVLVLRKGFKSLRVAEEKGSEEAEEAELGRREEEEGGAWAVWLKDWLSWSGACWR